MATEALALENVDALYGESHVLHGVSFALGEGRVLALLGRNGAGKTTCMNTAIGFLPPRNGSVRVFGEPVQRLAPDVISRKGIGLVPQGRRVFPRLTVRENLVVARQKRAGAWTLERVFELFPRLRERQGQDAGSLSGGEQQMLAIGRALMGNPRVLLLDEPLAGLSREERAQVKSLIAAIPRETTVVMIEHDMDTALDLADQITVLHYGRVIVEGTRAEVVADPKTREVYLGH